MPTPQGRYWRATIPVSCGYTPVLRGNLCYLKGQQEIGEGGYHHFQMVCVTNKKVTRAQLKNDLVPQANVDLTLSEAYNKYCWKDDTAVPDTRFELGSLPRSKARSTDWDAVYSDAISGNIDNIPKDILIRNYTSIKRIRVDNCTPPRRPDVTVRVYWGPTGTGKTHRCFDECGESFYVKNSRTKWWDGYQGQPNVIIDEFAGAIDVTYLLNWFDKYPCFAEVKGFSVPLQAVNFWVTSNIEPRYWYTDITQAHRDALLRRLTIVEEMTVPYVGNVVSESTEGRGTPRGVPREYVVDCHQGAPIIDRVNLLNSEDLESFFE